MTQEEKKKSPKDTRGPRNRTKKKLPFVQRERLPGELAIPGAPRKEVDWEQFDSLCGLHCTQAEIAHFFKMCVETLEERVKEKHGMLFSEYFKNRSCSGKISLRRAQFKNALNGNCTMQIWLGKQYLGQTDKIENDVMSRTEPIVVELHDGRQFSLENAEKIVTIADDQTP